MGIPFIRITQGTLKTEWPQVIFLLLIVIVLSGILVGLIDIPGGNLKDISLRPGIFLDPEGSLALPPLTKSPDFIVLIIAGIVLGLTLPLLTPIAASILVVLVTAPVLWLSLGNPMQDRAIPMQFSLLVILMLFGLNVLLNYFLDTQRKQKLIGVFGKFVPPEIVNELSKSPELIDLDGDSRELTIFFCDLKNFTTISESLQPKQLVSLLNEYLTLMTTILYKHGATIDKYIGDSIMAFWGAPLPQADHAMRAVQAAFEMQEAMIVLSEKLVARNLPALDMGVGINTGTANVGNMGSVYRLAYTAIGDAVNLSARLEALTRIYNVPIIIGEETANKLQGIAIRELDTVKVKGKNQESRIFEPLGPVADLNADTQVMLKSHEQAMTLYQQNHRGSLALFEELARFPGQAGYYHFMAAKTRDQLPRNK